MVTVTDMAGGMRLHLLDQAVKEGEALPESMGIL